jgi:hypothetical protein
MRISISYTALALALAAGTTAANAQTVITRQISDPPVETVITQQPVQTVQTTETVQTVRPASRSGVRRQVVTTRRTVVSQRIVPTQIVPTQTVTAPPVASTTIATYPQSLYDEAPLYDQVGPARTVDDMTILGAPSAVGTTIPVYRYIYEPDRILVIDPTTNIAIQALPR